MGINNLNSKDSLYSKNSFIKSKKVSYCWGIKIKIFSHSGNPLHKGWREGKLFCYSTGFKSKCQKHLRRSAETAKAERNHSPLYSLVGTPIWRRQWHPTPVLLPGKSRLIWELRWRSLVGYSPWGREELDTTERLQFHFPRSCIEEGNGNPLQCSCLENPRDGGAWWAAVYGVAQSQTRLKRLSSSSSRYTHYM